MQSPAMQLQPTPPSGSPSESDCFFIQPQTAPSPPTIFDLPFLDGDFDFQALLPPIPQQSPDDTRMHEVPSPPTDSRQECLQKLGDLHSALLADLNTVRASRVATESSIATLRADAAVHENCGCSVPIGRMFTTSAQLLEILHYFSAAPQSSSSSPPTSNPTLISNSSATPSDVGLLRPEIPTTLSILACYAALRRIYRTIFACIDASLQNFPPPLRSSALPPLFPGLALGGFQLGGNVGLQIVIVAQLSQSMLAKIDAALGLGPGGGGLVERQPGAADMFKAMIKEEEAEGPENEISGGCRPLEDIIGNVKRLC
ncbi:uncharacterized protein BKCO1_5300013 [Diplodia corticola]|uniref:Uncharacterized protein n=1 Tax=Diplodia corticola TaxID=236234 RepID=A0A1J9QQ54_9PEZI|nr:uncharacterized protein BKCO1_5300013 [Diplodia corticola]OJD31054.1 hypothetical protein BKCO1_5300013 [Diplodia corticola]